MSALLAPLMGHTRTAAVIGLCKNAGKTTALCRLLTEWTGETVALTSVGRDGESTDLATGTKKPAIRVPAGTIFATARGMLPLCRVQMEVLDVTDVSTPLGAVAILRAQTGGEIQLAGPSAAGQLEPLCEQFFRLGAQRVLIDGAAGRRSLASTGAAIVCTGASLGRSLPAVVEESAWVCRLFAAQPPQSPALKAALDGVHQRFALFTQTGEALPMPCDQWGIPLWAQVDLRDRVLWVGGGVTNTLLTRLNQFPVPPAVAVEDATHLLCTSRVGEQFVRRGGIFLVRDSIPVKAVCVNPSSALGGGFDPEILQETMARAISLPVIDVKREVVLCS